MKLFIDDMRIPPDNTWHLCKSVVQAVRALDQFALSVEKIQLDHDINQVVVVGQVPKLYPTEECFETVARYIAILKKLHPSWNPKIVLHTFNAVGADNMERILTEVGLEVEKQVQYEKKDN